MNKTMKKLAIAVAAVMVSGFGLQACGGEDNPFVAALGTNDGPSEAEIVSDSGDCGDCDGVIEDAVPGGVKGFFDADDDFYGLMELLRNMTWSVDGPAAEDIYIEFDGQRDDYFDGVTLAPGQVVTYGPQYGVVDFSDACAPGTGVLVIGVWGRFEGYPAEAGVKGAPWGEEIARGDSVNLVLSNCEIRGNLISYMPPMMVSGIETADTSVALSGNLTITWEREYMESSEDTTITMKGNLVVNPGVTEGNAGTEPTPVWGYGTPLHFNATASETQTYGFDSSEGGVCYDGPSAASAEACGDGIFETANDVIGYWDD
ncbi:MAG: hypothetical protein KDH09_10105 [Chrysiogenetes bacterium]|nr:hypothetical protein [Chrysiogenetes bacterium]